MIKVFFNDTLTGFQFKTYDFGNSIQNDETVIISFNHLYNYSPTTQLSSYNYDVEFTLDSYLLTTNTTSVYSSFIIPRFVNLQIVLPAQLFRTNSFEIGNNDNSNLVYRLGVTTVKGFLNPRLITSFMGYLQNSVDYALIDLVNIAPSRINLTWAHVKNTDTATSIVYGGKTRDGEGLSLTTLHTFSANGTYNLVNLLAANPFKLYLTSNGTTSSERIMGIVELLP